MTACADWGIEGNGEPPPRLLRPWSIEVQPRRQSYRGHLAGVAAMPHRLRRELLVHAYSEVCRTTLLTGTAT